MKKSFRNVRHLLEERVRETPDWTYLAFYGQYLTYAQFNEQINRFANALLQLGVKRGEVVYVHLSNRPEHLIACLAAIKIGAVAGPINVQLKPDEIEYQLNDSRGVALVTESALFPMVEPIRSKLGTVREVIELGDKPAAGNRSWTELINQASPKLKPIKLNPDDLCFIFYTSGTTGKPKGALLSHGNVINTMAGLQAALEQPGSTDTGAQRGALIFLPLFHVNAMMSMISGINRGLKVALLRRFSVREFGPAVEKEKPEFFSAVPKVYKILLEARDTVKNFNLSSLKFGVCGAAPMPVETIREFEKIYGIEILEGYGLTEATVASTLHRRGGKKKIGSIGQALEGQEVAIMDSNGKRLPPGEVGEIVIRGKSVMQGYFAKDEETHQTLRGGWLHTGDIGKEDAEGFFYIVDREKDMIIKGGENIYPKEIEEAISRHPSVHDVAVIGIPDQMSGEEVKAFVVPRLGPAGSGVTAEQIIAFCQKELADFKVPKEVELILGIPSSVVGKALKRKLRQGEGIVRLGDKTEPLPLEFVFKAMASRFNPEKAGKWEAVIQYEIYGGSAGVFSFIIKDGKIEVKPGPAEKATAIVRMYDVALRQLVERKIDAMTGINSGLIQIEGREADVAMFGEVMG